MPRSASMFFLISIFVSSHSFGSDGSLTGVWKYLASQCAKEDGANEDVCLRQWSTHHQTEIANEDPHAISFHFAIHYPENGDSIVCANGIGDLCDFDLTLRAPAMIKPMGGEVLLIRIQRRIVRSIVVAKNEAGGCPVIFSDGGSFAMEYVEGDQYNCFVNIGLFFNVAKAGKYTLQIDLVGTQFNYHFTRLSPKITFDVLFHGAIAPYFSSDTRAYGSDDDVLVTLLHFGSLNNLTRTIQSLRDAALVHIVKAPCVSNTEWDKLVMLEQTLFFTKLLAGRGGGIRGRGRVLLSNFAEKAVSPVWFGFHVVVEDWIEYAEDYLRVAVANVDFFGRRY
jgi:hypothetical protein